MKKARLNSHYFGISLKTSLACSIIVLLLLAGSSIISINLQSSLARGMIDRYGEMQKAALEEHTKTQNILLADLAKINAEICSGISESFLYNFDQIRLKTLLMTFLKIESIKAITVVDASNSPFAAAWKDPEIITGKSLPKDFTVDENLSFKSKAMHEKDAMGTIQVFYTDQLLVKELAKKQAQTDSDSQSFSTMAGNGINRSLKTQVIVTLCIIIALIATIAICLKIFVTSPINITVSMIRDIAEGEGDLTKRLPVKSRDEIGDLATWFNTFIEKLQGIIKDVAINAETLSTSSSELSEISSNMSNGAENLSDMSNSVATAAEEMSSNMNSVAAASEEASTNVNMVAASTEEMTATIKEITKNSEKTNAVTTQAVNQAINAEKKVKELGKAARDISKVTEVITDISEQTNLLALNATIEAARAGDAGKGFAVVANEIKELSRQTAKATLEIKERVSGIQISTDESVAEIVKISSVISNINDLVSTIVGSIEEQADATKEISENITQASRGIDEVNENVTQSSSVAEEIAKAIANVNQSVGEISSSSSMVDTSATELSNLADQLKVMVSKFKT